MHITAVHRVLVVFAISNGLALTLKVRLVSPGLTGLRILASITCTGPAFSAALDNLRRDYPAITFTHTFLYDRSITDCPTYAGEVQNILAKWYYSQEVCDDCVTVIVAPGCSDNIYLNQLAAAWNILFVSTTSADPIMRDKIISPTWFTTSLLPASYYGDMFYQLLLRNNWTSVYCLVDEDAVGFYQTVAIAFQRTASTSNVQLKKMSYWSTKGSFDHNTTLTRFSENSRIFVFFGSAAQFHVLLVYIGMEAFPYKPQVSFTWNIEKNNDKVLRAACRNVLLVTPVDVPRIQTPQLAKLEDAWMTKLRTTPFFENTDLHVEPAIPQLQTTNSAMEIIGQVLNETLSDVHPTWLDGTSLARRLYSRTFSTTTGQVELDRNGARAILASVSAFDSELGSFKIFLRPNVSHEVFRWTQIAEPVWFNQSQLPPNEPSCGYKAEQSGCDRAARDSSLEVILSTTLCLLTLLFSGCGYYYFTLSQQYDSWWMLSSRIYFNFSPRFLRIASCADVIGKVL